MNRQVRTTCNIIVIYDDVKASVAESSRIPQVGIAIDEK